MTRRGKLMARFKAKPKDFTWDELVRLLEGLGYREVAPGKTGGSRRRFVHETAPVITLHKPHPATSSGRMSSRTCCGCLPKRV